jgi:hypothetical protein
MLLIFVVFDLKYILNFILCLSLQLIDIPGKIQVSLSSLSLLNASTLKYSVTSRTPRIRISWEWKVCRYAENSDNRIDL